jgi:DNA-directed RNA polymerase subunit D
MMSEIPTMAIEWVDFVKNDSVLPDEIIANRLGQIPLTFSPGVYNLPDKCRCKGKGCSRCQVKLTLKRVGPGTVVSGDLRSRAKDVQPLFEGIPIVELLGEQELELEATAQLGLGREHAKWQGAVVGYKNKPRVGINTQACDGCGACLPKCPQKILQKSQKMIKVADPLRCSLCSQCVEVCPRDAIKVEPVEDAFVVNVESACGLDVRQVVMSAAQVLESKLREFGTQLGKLK